MCLMFSGCATTSSLVDRVIPKKKEAESITHQSSEAEVIFVHTMTWIGGAATIIGMILLCLPVTRHLGGWILVGGFATAAGSFFLVEYAQWFVGALILSFYSWFLVSVGRQMPQPNTLITKLINRNK